MGRTGAGAAESNSPTILGTKTPLPLCTGWFKPHHFCPAVRPYPLPPLPLGSTEQGRRSRGGHLTADGHLLAHGLSAASHFAAPTPQLANIQRERESGGDVQSTEHTQGSAASTGWQARFTRSRYIHTEVYKQNLLNTAFVLHLRSSNQIHSQKKKKTIKTQ